LSQLFTAAFLDPVALGYLAVAIAWSYIVAIVPTAVGGVLISRIAGAATDREQVWELARSTRLVMLFLIAATPAMIAACPLALPLLFGSSYEPAVMVAIILTVAAALSQLRLVISRGLRGIGKPQAELGSELVGTAVALLLLPLLLPALGLPGAAIAAAISEACATVTSLLLVTKFLNTSIPHLLVPRTADLQALTHLFRRTLAFRRRQAP
jgi:O-antigen/teichoic acid export membrane protein